MKYSMAAYSIDDLPLQEECVIEFSQLLDVCVYVIGGMWIERGI